MNQEQTRLHYLWELYSRKSISEKDLDELFTLLQRRENEAVMHSLLEQYFAAPVPAAAIDQEYWLRKLTSIKANANEVKANANEVKVNARTVGMNAWLRYAAAVILIILAGGVALIMTNRRREQAVAQSIPVQNDVAPGGNKAILTLGNGSRIVLDSSNNGLLAQQGSARVLKVGEGRLAYHTSDRASTIVLYNTLTTPRGGQYSLVLPDGSQVWLNAASSIRYPTVFSGKEREVEITGEAYFEVAKNKSSPFKVKINTPSGKGAEVEVLGTTFDINAYSDENNVETTLLEGSVKVISRTMAVGQQPGQPAVLLTPGQQAKMDRTGSLEVVRRADPDETVAWKNGRFSFDTDLESIMRQIARWYDVDIVYQDKITDLYTVKVSRNVPVSKLLQFMEMSGGVHFKIEGKMVTVMK